MSKIDLSHLRVLAVDDHPGVLKVLGIALNALGVTDVRTARSASEGFEEVGRSYPDLALCDMHMGSEDGIAFVKRVRNDPNSPNRYLPIIIVSGDSELTKVAEARDAGANDYLVKPLSAKALYARIAKTIDQPCRFVYSPTYFGPCRRRRNIGPPEGLPERRKNPEYEFI